MLQTAAAVGNASHDYFVFACPTSLTSTSRYPPPDHHGRPQASSPTPAPPENQIMKNTFLGPTGGRNNHHVASNHQAADLSNHEPPCSPDASEKGSLTPSRPSLRDLTSRHAGRTTGWINKRDVRPDRQMTMMAEFLSQCEVYIPHCPPATPGTAVTRPCVTTFRGSDPRTLVTHKAAAPPRCDDYTLH